MVKLSQTREKFSTKDPRRFPPYIHTIHRTCEKQASRKTNVHKCINHMYTCIYTHMHVCTLRHTNLCSSEAVSFHVKMAGLIWGESDPCWGCRRLNQSNPEQGEGKKNYWWQMRDGSWYPFVEKERLCRWKNLGLMSWSRERNKGRKDAVGGCGAESACSDPAPEWFSEYTREWPFNSKPTFSLVCTHTITRGVHMWKPWLIFCFCLQKFW